MKRSALIQLFGVIRLRERAWQKRLWPSRLGISAARRPGWHNPNQRARVQGVGDAEWRVLATSPRIMLNIPKRPHLPLDARGELVLVFWSFHNSPILVHELPPSPAAP